ncbi:MAG: DUF3520 domain-containing protein, partial [Methylobacteriaceae bacterium]|nr:DUF3520 domain-containing protein [Methylobacteriaceae bacterium]
YETFDAAPVDARFAVSVASFAELVKGAKFAGALTFDSVRTMAEEARGEDRSGYRDEFITLVRRARNADTL